MSTVALIPARGGSKSLPGKNLLEVGGRSLVVAAVEVAKDVTTIDEVVVSSDDNRILTAAGVAGASLERRSPSVSGDDTPTIDVVRAFLQSRASVNTLVVLQPTSPLRIPQDVEHCLETLRDGNTATTVTESEHPVEWSFGLSSDSRLQPILGWESLAPRRQDARRTYRLNGAVYAARADHLRSGGALVDADTLAVVMPKERSVDIDDEVDLVVARAMAAWLRGRA